MGVCAVCVLLILKFAVLAVHISAESWWLIVIAPVLGRTMIIALFLTTPYVRPGGLGESLAAQLPRRSAWIVLIAVFATAVIAGGVWAAAGALLAFVLLRKLMMRMIGGTTGDTAGALVEVTEAAALVAAAI
jgi:adenosylcobinamide-GDP ribazoletransferase